MTRKILIRISLLISLPIGLQATDPPAAPFEVEFLKKARWTEGREGFDPQLPGYHITGDIAKIALRPTGVQPPKELTLAINTSPGMRPNLEGLSIDVANRTIDPSLQARVPTVIREHVSGLTSNVARGTYITTRVESNVVHVSFTPAGMALLSTNCTIRWVDWYRQ